MRFLFIIAFLTFSIAAEAQEQNPKHQQIFHRINHGIQNGKLILESIDASNVLPGTVVFLGNSEKDIQAVLTCLEDGTCRLMTFENEKTKIQTLNVNEVNLSKYPYHGICKASDNTFAKKEIPNKIVDAPTVKDETVENSYINEQHLPLVVTPKNPEMSFADVKIWAKKRQIELKKMLKENGAVLLRGFQEEALKIFVSRRPNNIRKRLSPDYKNEGSRDRIIRGSLTLRPQRLQNLAFPCITSFQAQTVLLTLSAFIVQLHLKRDRTNTYRKNGRCH